MPLLATLPLDVLDRILAFAQDYHTLRAVSLSCKSIYKVYKAHPTSIDKSVAFNLIPGTALAPALQAIRVEHDLAYRSLVDDQGVKVIVHEHDEAKVLNTPLTPAECKSVQARAMVAARLEIFYSRKCKDRSSGSSSRLSASESETFQKSLHRIWLRTTVIRHCYLEMSTTFSDFDWRKDLFYSTLSSQDIWELDTVRRWLDDISSNLDSGVDEEHIPLLVAAGPEGIMKLYEMDPSYEVDDSFHDVDEPLDFEWEEDIRLVLGERKIDVNEDGTVPKGLKPLLETVIGKDDPCTVCSAPLGFALLNKTNWEYSGWLAMGSFLFFPQYLRANSFERNALGAYLRNPLLDVTITTYIPTASPMSNATVLRELFELPNVITSPRLQAHMLKDSFSSISSDDWICTSCTSNFITQRLWIWWWNEKARGRVVGGTLREDCWYGYECRTQTHNPAHAQKLNHLCVNTYAERQAAKRAKAAAAQGSDGGPQQAADGASSSTSAAVAPASAPSTDTLDDSV
ncbi:hypothetical protein EXIGLDRAFT_726679 [Exidia glandulosa HHB12029]|uniref:Uncharacterized protein n=1 Tax=Exidia glandulosa HHB12029 TaxID=1314781 RepID=A0A165DLX4_EXIGL|nr:hypothetical protein EXIGLDRAFT_726679 [Exidia glandulosa HHB12029]